MWSVVLSCRTNGWLTRHWWPLGCLQESVFRCHQWTPLTQIKAEARSNDNEDWRVCMTDTKPGHLQNILTKCVKQLLHQSPDYCPQVKAKGGSEKIWRTHQWNLKCTTVGHLKLLLVDEMSLVDHNFRSYVHGNKEDDIASSWRLLSGATSKVA